MKMCVYTHVCRIVRQITHFGSKPLMKSPRRPAARGGHVDLNSEKGILGQDIL